METKEQRAARLLSMNSSYGNYMTYDEYNTLLDSKRLHIKMERNRKIDELLNDKTTKD